MAFDIVFSERAARELKKLDKQVQQRIISKLKEYARDENLKEAKRLTNPILGTWRYRVGDWRIIFDLEDKELQILKVGNRREVYD
jgi:mRNA interferase RelE/StbE